MKRYFFTLILCLVLICTIVQTRELDEVAYVSEGNFALPSSQEPSPLFCFGQNIIDKGDLQGFVFADSVIGKNNNFTEIVPTIFYGITDKLVLTAGMPIAVNIKSPNSPGSRGIASIFAQFEYAFYNDDHPTYANQATVVANVTLPTRSKPTNFPSLFGNAPFFFFGLTASHMATDWYYFGSSGFTTPIAYHGAKQPMQFLYQGGICRNLYYVPHKTIISLMLELFGVYSNKGTFAQTANQNQQFGGGNVFYIGPSLWIATQRFIIDIGVLFPVTKQHTRIGKNTCIVAIETGWKFNT